MAAALVAHVEVGFVAEHEQSVPADELGQTLELPRRAFDPRRVVQVVQDEQLRGWRDEPLDLLQVEREAVGSLDVGVRHRTTAEELDQRAVDRKARVRVEHLVAGIHQS